MDISTNFALVERISCFISLAFIIIGLPSVQISHASFIAPERSSTLSNLSASNFESNPITTIIIPNESSRLVENSTAGENVTNIILQNVTKSSSLSPADIDSVGGINESNTDSLNDTLKANFSSEVSSNNTLSNSEQRGDYLTDNNGIHYYNINNCSEKKGSSGIGELSECEDAAKEMRKD